MTVLFIIHTFWVCLCVCLWVCLIVCVCCLVLSIAPFSLFHLLSLSLSLSFICVPMYQASKNTPPPSYSYVWKREIEKEKQVREMEWENIEKEGGTCNKILSLSHIPIVVFVIKVGVGILLPNNLDHHHIEHHCCHHKSCQCVCWCASILLLFVLSWETLVCWNWCHWFWTIDFYMRIPLK